MQYWFQLHRIAEMLFWWLQKTLHLSDSHHRCLTDKIQKVANIISGFLQTYVFQAAYIWRLLLSFCREWGLWGMPHTLSNAHRMVVCSKSNATRPTGSAGVWIEMAQKYLVTCHWHSILFLYPSPWRRVGAKRRCGAGRATKYSVRISVCGCVCMYVTSVLSENWTEWTISVSFNVTGTNYTPIDSSRRAEPIGVYAFAQFVAVCGKLKKIVSVKRIASTYEIYFAAIAAILISIDSPWWGKEQSKINLIYIQPVWSKIEEEISNQGWVRRWFFSVRFLLVCMVSINSSVRAHFETVRNSCDIRKFGGLSSKNSVGRGTTYTGTSAIILVIFIL